MSAYYHDSAAVLLRDGSVIAAAQEERFTRRKHDPAFPAQAAAFCLQQCGARWEDIDFAVFYEKPARKIRRQLRNYLAVAPSGFESFSAAFSAWWGGKAFQRPMLLAELHKLASHVSWSEKLLFAEHHVSHAASAFFASPFEAAAVLVTDGVGELSTTSIFEGDGNRLTLRNEIHFPHSLGLLYSAFTAYTGFKVDSGEYKMMGLAPYGRPRFVQTITDHLIDVRPDGSFRLNMEYFGYTTGLQMINDRFCGLFGELAREAEQPLTAFHMDIAASIQEVLDDVLLKMTCHMAEHSNTKSLCMAGGVALNCVSNGRILRDGAFHRIWIQPAAGDAGGALGAALSVHYSLLQSPRTVNAPDGMQGSYLGPEFSQAEIEDRLRSLGAVYSVLTDEQFYRCSAAAMADGQALGWFQGRMEFGPRALGNRSILADPRIASVQTTLNLKIKKRESFRPFAPSVLAQDVAEYFELSCESPYMLLVAHIAQSQRLPASGRDEELFGLARLAMQRSTIPGVTHVDMSARIQTVRRETNPRYHRLLLTFKELTGCSVLVNTSFNVRGEPIVCTPEDAFRCFMTTGIEALAIGNCFLYKKEQDPGLAAALAREFPPD